MLFLLQARIYWWYWEFRVSGVGSAVECNMEATRTTGKVWLLIFLLQSFHFLFVMLINAGESVSVWISRSPLSDSGTASIHSARGKVQGVLLLVSQQLQYFTESPRVPSYSLSLSIVRYLSVHCCRDSYWIVRGLLLCNMTETARNMILNMVSMVER